ncbi:MAG TPA: alpha/beta hydrolase, partial [Streptosporangiaceae bacterium]
QYAVVPGFRPLVLDLHVPAGQRTCPVVVYAHGGGFVGGSRTMGPWAFLLEAGYAVASVDYRLASEAQFPFPIHDLAAAVRWVRANAEKYRLDPGLVIGFGSSAGGYLMNALALTGPDLPGLTGSLGPTPEVSIALDAMIDHYAPTDFSTLGITADSPLLKFLGFDPSQRPEDAELANLCRYATAGSPPFLIAHGDADTVVDFEHSRRLFDALTSAGARAELIVVEGANHGAVEFDQPAMHTQTLNFLESVAKSRA